MYICQYCSKECKSIHSLHGHERLCKLNPNYEENHKIHHQNVIESSIKRMKEIYDADPLNQIKTYNLICSKCGKEYQLDIKVRLYERGCYRKTCSNKCANSRKWSNESNEQRSNKIKQERLHVCPICGKTFMYKGVAINTRCDDCQIKRRSENIGLHKINCEICNKEIYVKAKDAKYCYECCNKLGKKPYQIYSFEGKKIFSTFTKQKLSEATKQLMAKGKIKPWQSRNIKSYAEKFFHKVLSLNNIPYEHEVSESGYFLDFVIKTKTKIIDLEIDGKQHWTDQERIEHDKIRDAKMTSLGYYVYRIPWNSINNDKRES